MTAPDFREALRDELTGWTIGSGYYQTSVDADTAADQADAVLALLAERLGGDEAREVVGERLCRHHFGDRDLASQPPHRLNFIHASTDDVLAALRDHLGLTR